MKCGFLRSFLTLIAGMDCAHLVGQAAFEPVALLHVTNSSWKYFEPAALVDPGLGTVWREPGFDDASWPTGHGLFGTDVTDYGYPFHTPLTPPGSGGPVTTYYRTRFVWGGDPARLVLSGELCVDDGVVIYLNGREGYRFNMPSSEPRWDTRALGPNPGGEPVILHLVLPATNVVGGGVENVLAVELHQNSTTSSDCVFGLSLVGDTARAPTVLRQPAGTNVLQGRPFTLEVEVDGLPIPTCQWYQNALPINEATNATYSVGFAEPGVHEGAYYVVARNSAGQAQSATVSVAVQLDTEGPEFVSGLVQRDGTVRLVFSEVMSNTFDPFSVYVFESGGSGLFDVQTWVLDTNETEFVITPSDPLRLGISYSVFIGPGAVFDQFGNVFAGEQGAGINRTLASEVPLLLANALWAYEDSSPPLELIRNEPPHFYDADFDDRSWKRGLAPLGVETDGNLPDGLTINTTVLNTGADGPITSYYRIRFVLSGSVWRLLLRTLVDDGAVVYLNGTEVLRLGVPGGQDSTTPASRSVGNATWEGPFELPVDLLRDGENLLAVELHNVDGSSDNVWACDLFTIGHFDGGVAPYLIEQPVGPGSYVEGSSFTLSVVAAGTPPLHYQWHLNGNPIPGATNAVYSVAWMLPPDAGDYVVVVTNLFGSATSDVVTVWLEPPMRPVLVSAVAMLDPTRISIDFSEPMLEETATNLAHYTVEPRSGGGALTVLRADLNNGTNVLLTTTDRLLSTPCDVNYRLLVRDLADRSYYANLINPNPTVVALPTEVILVDYDAMGSWAYDDSGADPGTAWMLAGFDDSGWSYGEAFFYAKRGTPGALDLPVSTTLDLTNAPGVINAIGSEQTITFYFRGDLDLSLDLLQASTLKFQYILDDGAVFYVNGEEVLRVGMPSGVITNETLASRVRGNNQLWELPVAVDASLFVSGPNLVAVGVHQTSITSSDVAFALRLIGTLDHITPALRITGIVQVADTIVLEHNGACAGVAEVFVQESSNLIDWATISAVPQVSPVSIAWGGEARFYRLSSAP